MQRLRGKGQFHMDFTFGEFEEQADILGENDSCWDPDIIPDR